MYIACCFIRLFFDKCFVDLVSYPEAIYRNAFKYNWDNETSYVWFFWLSLVQNGSIEGLNTLFEDMLFDFPYSFLFLLDILVSNGDSFS